MDDDRVRAFEERLWLGGEEVYRQFVARDCVMVVPQPPFVMGGEDAIAAVADSPRWSEVELRGLRISRPRDGLIVLAYEAAARRGDQAYRAYCTSTYLRLGPDEWRVVQHQQTVPPTAA
ncbi:MAG TPA: DUF4440 domain-containing protein [Allosphingosinicella sp.]|nr:DUF4440 domain-containing protein [Allosphingosinicella sp.]